MLVCHCRSLTDRDVRDAVRGGAMSCASVARACGAGSECGGCRPIVSEIIDQERAPEAQQHHCTAAASTLIEARESLVVAG